MANHWSLTLSDQIVVQDADRLTLTTTEGGFEVRGCAFSENNLNITNDYTVIFNAEIMALPEQSKFAIGIVVDNSSCHLPLGLPKKTYGLYSTGHLKCEGAVVNYDKYQLSVGDQIAVVVHTPRIPSLKPPVLMFALNGNILPLIAPIPLTNIPPSIRACIYFEGQHIKLKTRFPTKADLDCVHYYRDIISDIPIAIKDIPENLPNISQVTSTNLTNTSRGADTVYFDSNESLSFAELMDRVRLVGQMMPSVNDPAGLLSPQILMRNIGAGDNEDEENIDALDRHVDYLSSRIALTLLAIGGGASLSGTNEQAQHTVHEVAVTNTDTADARLPASEFGRAASGDEDVCLAAALIEKMKSGMPISYDLLSKKKDAINNCIFNCGELSSQQTTRHIIINELEHLGLSRCAQSMIRSPLTSSASLIKRRENNNKSEQLAVLKGCFVDYIMSKQSFFALKLLLIEGNVITKQEDYKVSELSHEILVALPPKVLGEIFGSALLEETFKNGTDELQDVVRVTTLIGDHYLNMCSKDEQELHREFAVWWAILHQKVGIKEIVNCKTRRLDLARKTREAFLYKGHQIKLKSGNKSDVENHLKSLLVMDLWSEGKKLREIWKAKIRNGWGGRIEDGIDLMMDISSEMVQDQHYTAR